MGKLQLIIDSLKECKTFIESIVHKGDKAPEPWLKLVETIETIETMTESDKAVFAAELLNSIKGPTAPIVMAFAREVDDSFVAMLDEVCRKLYPGFYKKD